MLQNTTAVINIATILSDFDKISEFFANMNHKIMEIVTEGKNLSCCSTIIAI